MKKTHIEIKEVQEEIIDAILCNKCGESCHNGDNYEGLVEVCICGGYGSYIGDRISLTFSICEKCLWDYIKTFKIPPDKNDPWDSFLE